MNEDHSLIAFTIDIGNHEKLTAGFKDMNSQQILDLKLNDISQVEFFGTEGEKVDENGIN